MATNNEGSFVMATAEGLVIGAGAVSFLGNFKESGGWPSNGYKILGATAVLAVLAAFSQDSRLAGPIKALAALMLLVSVYKYVPTLSKKGK